MSAVAAAKSALEAAAAAAASGSNSLLPGSAASSSTGSHSMQRMGSSSKLNPNIYAPNGNASTSSRSTSPTPPVAASAAAAAAMQLRWAVVATTLEEVRGFLLQLRSRGTSSNRHSLTASHAVVAFVLKADTQQDVEQSDRQRKEMVALLGSGATLYATQTELLNHASSFDGILLSCGSAAAAKDAAALLEAGKSVLLPKPLSMTASQVKGLCEVARRRKAWLGMPMKLGEKALLSAADECAQAQRYGRSESSAMPWSATLTVLEVLEDLRSSGSFSPSSTPQDAATPRAAYVEISPSSSSGISVNGLTTGAAPSISPSSTSSRISSLSSSPVMPSSRRASEQQQQQQHSPVTASSSRRPSEQSQQQPPFKLVRPTTAGSLASERSFASASVGHANVGHGDEEEDVRDAASVSLRAQLEEMQRRLQQKDDVIAALERKVTGVAQDPTSDDTVLGTTMGRSNGIVASDSAATVVAPPTSTPRRKSLASHAALGMGVASVQPTLVSRESSRDSRASSPTGSVASSTHSARSRTSSGTRRKSSMPSSAEGAIAANAREKRKSSFTATTTREEGFMAPTRSSEARRASVTSAASDVAAAGALATSATSKVIAQLTRDLDEARSTLDATRVTLRTTQQHVTTLERTLQETKAGLGRSRAENETNTNILMRKDRQASEALERARKAEAEAKALGRASREWGARVRVVEAELGEERRKIGKAEASYEAISVAWKAQRDRWTAEVHELREEVRRTIANNATEARKMCTLFEESKTAWSHRENERESLDNTLQRLRDEREKASLVVERQVAELVQRLELHEQHTKSQDDTVEACAADVRRIIRLARAGDTTTPVS